MAHRRRSLRSPLIPLSAALLLAGTVVSTASAASPDSGTIGTTATSTGWQGKSYTVISNPDRRTCTSKALDPNNAACDHYMLTVNVDPSYYNTHTGGAKVRVSWQDAGDDFDLFVYKGSTLVASSAQGDTTSEQVIIDRASGTYEVRVSPFLVTTSGYQGTATFQSAVGVTRPPLGRPWKYHGTRITGALPSTEPQNRPTTDRPELAPLTLKFYDIGRQAAEPTIAVDRRVHTDPTTGNTIQGNAYVPAATFDATPVGLADTRIRRSRSEGRTWEDATAQPIEGELPVTLDPYIYVEEDSQRLFDLDLYVASANLLFSDDGAKTFKSNPIASGPNLVNDHQTLYAGPRPAGLTLPPNQFGDFDEILYYCFNRVTDSTCSRSFDGGRTFAASAPGIGLAYPGSNSSGTFCGGLTGHVRTDPAGRVFLPRGYCNKPFVAISNDAGLTFKRVKVSDTVETPGHNTAMASDLSGNLYYVWTDRKYGLPFLATSTDHGLSWSKPLMIAPPNVREVAGFSPSIAAGPSGKIAISFPATTQVNQGDLTRPWDIYVAYSVDALSSNPTFVSNIANLADDPVHRGNCPDRCGNMLDFLDTVISPASPGHAIWATVVDTCTAKDSCNTDPNAKGFDGSSDNAASDMRGMVVREITGAPDLGPPSGCTRACPR